MATPLSFQLNGQSVTLKEVSPNTTLLDFLRWRGLAGSKEGCAEGDCGACSVVTIERDADGKPVYRAVNSCLLPVCLLAGREVVSVEGVCHSTLRTPHAAPAGLHPVQRTMVEGFGSQCGYCTPGFICSLFEGYYRDDLRTPDDLDDQLSGNLCRCTGYRAIRDAAIEAFAGRAAGTGDDVFTRRLQEAGLNSGAVNYKYCGETFLRPTSLAELLQQLEAHPAARLIAGATELGLDITKRFKKFATLISVEAVTELKEIKATPTEWRIGAAVTLTDIEEWDPLESTCRHASLSIL